MEHVFERSRRREQDDDRLDAVVPEPVFEDLQAEHVAIASRLEQEDVDALVGTVNTS